MTARNCVENDFYYEVCIALDFSEFGEIFTSEIMDFSGEAVEIADNQIIIRTSKDKDFIDALLAHLENFSANLAHISGKIINFTHSIEKKQNKDWIAEYKSGIKPIRCGRFYIYPPWCDSANLACSECNSSLDKHFDDFENSPSLAEGDKGGGLKAKNISSAKFSNNESTHPLTPSAMEGEQNNANEYPRTNCKQDDTKLINIILEPSFAFGTGHHASTFMCIQAIESLGENGDLKNKTLLDFGCGSGILALCANKLGAKVDLCDIDELAIDESKKNFCRNNATISHIWQGEIHRESKGNTQDLRAKYDIITANIIASVLIEQKENIAFALKSGGIAILSGILDIYKNEVLARFSDFEVLNIAQKDEWICIMLQKF